MIVCLYEEKRQMIAQMSVKSKIYHRPGCRYIDRIANKSLTAYDINDKKLKAYTPCKCCCKLKNIYKNIEPEFKEKFVDLGIKVEADENYLLVNTPSYNWRVDFALSNQKLKLYAGSLHEGQQEYTWTRWSECESTGNLQSVMQFILNEEKLAAYPSQYRKYVFQIEEYAKTNNICIEYDGTDLYVLTNMAAWKIAYGHHFDWFKLLHCPFSEKALTMEEAKAAHYHVQTDVPRNQSPYKHLKYIVKHDEAKEMEQIDYRKLPQRTKKEKKYYRQAKNRAKRKNVNRVLDLFVEIEAKEGIARVAIG